MNAPSGRTRRVWVGLLSVVITATPGAQLAPAPSSSPAVADYRLPPKQLLDILDAPAPPYATVSADEKWLITTERDIDHTTIAELAEPMLMLAGTRFKVHPEARIENTGITKLTLKSIDGAVQRTLLPPPGGHIVSLSWVRDSATGGEGAYTVVHDETRMSIHLYDATSGISRPIATPGLSGRIGGLNFTRDGRYLAFNATTREGVTLWIANTSDAAAKKVEGVFLNHVNGGTTWTRGKPPLIARMIPAERGAPPTKGEVPTGPVIQESYGRTAQGRTFQDMLKDSHDEALYEYYFTNQAIAVDERGRVTKLGAPGINFLSASPNGEYLLVTTIHRPYSYQVPMGLFPSTTAVWTRAGGLVAVVNEQPLRDNLPSARDATLPGIRSVYWRADVPATLVLVEALDGGDPRKEVPRRDRVSLLTAPFTGERTTFIETELRFGGIMWAFPDLALVTERSSRTARTRTWVVAPADPAAAPRRLWDRNSEDRYADPGSLVLTEHPTELRQVPLRSGNFVYLQGTGAAKDGAKPFLDRLDLTTLQTERLWQSAPPNYEYIVKVMDPEARRIVFSRESPADRPNLFLRELARGSAQPLTDLPEPAPWFAAVKGELVRYQREDGIELTATLYLPPNYNRERDGALPFFLWAYPQEFLTQTGATQISGSPLQFKRPGRSDHLLLLAQGYGVLENPKMPIVGRDGKEPNDGYVEQLVASAKAAVDFLVARGVGDRNRMGIGGHSYGAFMTANLLAHSDLFRAGIARSGAYNRTLTPFGFQAEPRTYWQAPEIYHQMSPFTHVPKVNEPILLIHGMRDSNTGTFPVQSERMFAALKGAGGNVRYVQLPLEDHGYIAKESRRHVLWEMITWLDKYVKATPVKESVAAGGGN
ncbi:MAG: prolyl oligopeptidase family serine peptidase [Opitutaceae bacterium]|nr:prolyl oligopeptidase family serine peptidase [Opitutaceae bacterium]